MPLTSLPRGWVTRKGDRLRGANEGREESTATAALTHQTPGARQPLVTGSATQTGGSTDSESSGGGEGTAWGDGEPENYTWGPGAPVTSLEGLIESEQQRPGGSGEPGNGGAGPVRKEGSLQRQQKASQEEEVWPQQGLS